VRESVTHVNRRSGRVGLGEASWFFLQGDGAGARAIGHRPVWS
jgi:hypothetical protein